MIFHLEIVACQPGQTAIHPLQTRNSHKKGPLKSALTNKKGKSAVQPKKPSDKGKKEEADPGLVRRLTTAIGHDDHFAVDAGGKLYVYAIGVFIARGEQRIKCRVKQLLSEWEQDRRWSSKLASEVVQYILADAPQLWERPPSEFLNLRNGLLDLKANELKPHSPRFLSSIQLPVLYDPKAKCPAWEKFIGETVPEDAVKAGIAWEIVAWLMGPIYWFQKALLLIGDGANGKSTFIRALIALIGRRNVSSLSLHRLESDRFAVSRLVGKVANVCADLPSTELVGTSVFKAITGQDPIAAEYKFKDGFDLRPFCRLVFSANHAPRSPDASPAFFRRWLVLPFTQIFEEKDQIHGDELDTKLADPQELSGVLNKALKVLPKVEREGITETASMKSAWLDFRQTTDPIGVWLDSEAIESPDRWIIKDDLWLAYQKDAIRRNRPSGTKQGFGRMLKRLRPKVNEAQKKVEGTVRWAWEGIGLRGKSLESPPAKAKPESPGSPAKVH